MQSQVDGVRRQLQSPLPASRSSGLRPAAVAGAFVAGLVTAGLARRTRKPVTPPPEPAGSAWGVGMLYHAAPNVRRPRFRWISVGAAVAILAWLIASLSFSVYVANLGSYDKTFGALAGVIAFLLWLWITNVALLFGAELNAEMERGRQLQAGITAEKDLKLPLRDTSVIDKNDAKDVVALRRGRMLRRSRGRRG